QREFPAWLPATLLILGLFVGLFTVLYIGSLKLASYAPAPPPPVPVTPAPPPPPPPPPPQQGSRVFSFDNAPQPTTPTPPPPPPPPATQVAVVEPEAKPFFPVVPAPPPKDLVVNDEALNTAITKGVNHLLTRFSADYKLKMENDH